jgi:cystathionine beta-lyase/cystathionine gamma-synthase
MKTVVLRVERQSENALRLAQALEKHPAVDRVHYPGLPSHAGHDAARRQMKAFGAMLAFDLKGGLEAARIFLSKLKLIPLATSLGSVETTADMPWLTSHRHVTPEKKRSLGIQDGTIRLSVGTESFDDLARHHLRPSELEAAKGPSFVGEGRPSRSAKLGARRG